MRYKLLGKSGLRVSEVCLGTMMMSTESPSSAGPEESRRILEAFAEKGGNYFDTANEVYNDGLSERILGEFVASDRHRYVVTTKYTNTRLSLNRLYSGKDPRIRDHPNAGGNHKKSMVHSVEGSLKRLGVDYIDLLWIHFWEYSTDIADVMRNVNDLVQQGKVLHFGLCNTPAWVVARGPDGGRAARLGADLRTAVPVQPGLEGPGARGHSLRPRARHQRQRLLAAGRRLPDRQVHAGRQHGGAGATTAGASSRPPSRLTRKSYEIARKVDEIADRLGTRLGRGGPGVGAEPRRDPDGRGPQGLPDREQPAVPGRHPPAGGHAGAERDEAPPRCPGPTTCSTARRASSANWPPAACSTRSTTSTSPPDERGAGPFPNELRHSRQPRRIHRCRRRCAVAATGRAPDAARHRGRRGAIRGAYARPPSTRWSRTASACSSTSSATPNSPTSSPVRPDGPDRLTAGERLRWNSYMTAVFRHMGNLLYQHETGAMEDKMWESLPPLLQGPPAPARGG